MTSVCVWSGAACVRGRWVCGTPCVAEVWVLLRTAHVPLMLPTGRRATELTEMCTLSTDGGPWGLFGVTLSTDGGLWWRNEFRGYSPVFSISAPRKGVVTHK